MDLRTLIIKTKRNFIFFSLPRENGKVPRGPGRTRGGSRFADSGAGAAWTEESDAAVTSQVGWDRWPV